jgi:putative copper resistance protein D
MQAFADFLDGLLGGTVLVGLALAAGGVVWTAAVLRPWRAVFDARIVRRALAVTAAGAMLLALAQAALIGVKVALLADLAGDAALARFADTLQFRASVVRGVIALALAGWVLRLRGRPAEPRGWVVAGLLAAALVASGAWLVHAAGRLESRAALMALTVLHQLAASVWVGGVLQLVALGRLARRDPVAAAVWPPLVARFSRLAGIALAAVVAGSVPLVWSYVASWEGLVGTGYGSLVATKAALLAVVLALGAGNFAAARAFRRHGDARAVSTRAPVLIEAEALLLVILLFTARSLSSQPPPVDAVGERATPAEVAEVFRPKLPRLATPSIEAMRTDDDNPLLPDAGRTVDEYAWSNYSHNVAGLLLLAMSLGALAARAGVRSARHWPAGFVALAAFVFLRTSANEGTWPFGPTGVLENALDDAESLQHRIGALLALAVGLVEWRAHATDRPGRLAYLFPALAAFGGVILLTHSHAAFEPKHAYLVQITHSTMGALAVLMACGRWLELKLTPPLSRIGGTASAVAMLAVALILVFYREANLVLPDPPAETHAQRTLYTPAR